MDWQNIGFTFEIRPFHWRLGCEYEPHPLEQFAAVKVGPVLLRLDW